MNRFWRYYWGSGETFMRIRVSGASGQENDFGAHDEISSRTGVKTW